MSIRDNCKRIVIKGSSEPSPTTYPYSTKIINCQIELWQLNILEAIQEKLTNDNGCEVWVSQML